MSGDIVNLRRHRKAKERAAAEQSAAENRVRFGKSKGQRRLETKLDALEQSRLDGHRREGPAPSATDGLPPRSAPSNDQ